MSFARQLSAGGVESLVGDYLASPLYTVPVRGGGLSIPSLGQILHLIPTGTSPIVQSGFYNCKIVPSDLPRFSNYTLHFLDLPIPSHVSVSARLLGNVADPTAFGLFHRTSSLRLTHLPHHIYERAPSLSADQANGVTLTLELNAPLFQRADLDLRVLPSTGGDDPHFFSFQKPDPRPS